MHRILLAIVMLAFVLSGCLGADNGDLDPVAGVDEDDTDDAIEVNITAGPVQEETLDWAVGISGCVGVFLADLAGIEHAEAPLRSEAQGLPFTATFTSTAPTVEVGVSFFDGDSFLETFASPDTEVAGIVPTAANVAVFWSCGGTDVRVEFTAGA